MNPGRDYRKSKEFACVVVKTKNVGQALERITDLKCLERRMKSESGS